MVAVAGGGSVGGLGLVRVAYEGGCTLAMSTEGNEITVTAERRHAATTRPGAPARA
jgi:hypothetical protein